MTVQVVNSLRAPPVVGQLYSVPTVRYPWLLDERHRPWPVLLPRHADDLLEFPHPHYHVDPRFLGASVEREALEYLRAYFVKHLRDPGALAHRSDAIMATAYVAALAPLSRGEPGGGHVPHPPIRWRTMRCTRDSAPHLAADVGATIQFEFAGRACRKVRSGWVCPHQRFPLGSMGPDAEGIVVCPLHGLRIDAATGVALEAVPP